MAHRATDALASHRAVLEERVLEVVDLWNRGGVLGLAGVELELPLSHGVVAGEAEVDDLVLLAGKVPGQERELAVELRVENRIAAGQSHRRPPPLAVRRDVDQRLAVDAVVRP